MGMDLARFTSAFGGSIVGKVRFHKSVYLLDQLGLDSGYEYEYHHYGPFSDDLANTLELESAFGEIEEETRFRQSDGVPYSVFKSRDGVEISDSDFGSLTLEQVQDYSSTLDKYSATVLELAATAYWLVHEEGYDDWRSEIVERKGVKTQGGRLDEAVVLLGELGLAL